MKVMIKRGDALFQFEMGNSNGTVTRAAGQNTLKIILNMPVDPLELPAADKTVAYLIFPADSLTANQVALFLC